VRVLVIANMFPTASQPSRGIFVVRRLKEHRAAGMDITAVALRPVRGELRAELASLSGRPTDDDLPRGDFLDLRVKVSIANAMFERRYYPAATVRAAAKQLLELVDASSYDVIHAHGMYRLPAGAVAGKIATLVGVPYVVTMHGSDVNSVMACHPRAHAAVLRRAAGLSFVSEALREYAGSLGTDLGRSHVIPNGVDCDVFRPTMDISTSRTLETPVVAYIGNLEPIKGADRLPAIFRAIALKFPGVSFVVAGDGMLRDSLERASLGLQLKFLGQISGDRVPDVMNDADLVLLPSRNEGWPCVVLEAHACETPVIGSDVGGMAEAIGDSSFLVPQGPEFEARFAERAVALLSVHVADRNLRARAALYSWSAVAAREREMLTAASNRVTRP
jgi:teichuronic acid biosynthesis glycosyltransferase TuaC